MSAECRIKDIKKAKMVLILRLVVSFQRVSYNIGDNHLLVLRPHFLQRECHASSWL